MIPGIWRLAQLSASRLLAHCRYIIAVGWDKRINIYADSIADVGVHHVQHPNPGWHDDLVRDPHQGHEAALRTKFPR